MTYPLITLCGSYNFTKHWVRPCIESWKKISNVDHKKWHLVADNRLSIEDEREFSSLGFKVYNSDESKGQISTFLKKYPALEKIREKDLTWRKLLDTSILLKGIGKVVLIDTDVLVAHNCKLPEGDFDICYMREDIPAYRAHWKIVWEQQMVPAFNAGAVIFDPDSIDFSYLEYLTGKYFLQCKDYWWSEQSAWACLAGRMRNRLLFDGNQVRVLSGFKKRSVEEVLLNKYNYFGKRGVLEKFEEFKPFVEGSTIIHFAGLGKKWFSESYDLLLRSNFQPDETVIRAHQEETLNMKDKIFIGTRLLLKELK
ncbi:hypothetical protein [Desertivirga xinjiangensis]|uniref:hypothetical protein n=1 Tax=Desertivirga xinjiangensis TaxID=539206 RepID=UPI00210D8CE9|nr:hypothetical protein [Pedobacter xinjiangensis]